MRCLHLSYGALCFLLNVTGIKPTRPLVPGKLECDVFQDTGLSVKMSISWNLEQ